ncbi:uncharacterized protein LOC124142868 [Haliotis rufescens]|uniref:uncharacterized protein LOC124142868 n=1 Tax=Haliotis rufescens TaxID=6454 RepID=UPI00201F4EF2|nr:uncharacterized protein LOC124142868 [Haliotis rufescens]
MLQVFACLVLCLPVATNCLHSSQVRNNRQLQAGPRCYSCQGVNQPYNCNVTVTCQPQEQCFTDEYSTVNGHTSFTVGCRPMAMCNSALGRRSEVRRSNDPTLKCEECCHGDQCNSGGCSAGPPKGYSCYECDFIDDPKTCDKETRCNANEHCYVDKVYTDNYNIKYNLGCAEDSECNIKGDRKRDKVLSTMCSACCDGNYCNQDCQNPILTHCYSCLRIDHPYNCNLTVECRPNEQCYVDKYMTERGTSVYDAGCRAVSICAAKLGRRSEEKRVPPTLKCEECCHGNYCNKEGCDAEPAKGTVCYDCNFISNPTLCYKKTTCRTTQQCYAQKVLTDAFVIKYKLGCLDNDDCKTLQRKKRDQVLSTMCASCCDVDNCNNDCA